MEGPVSPTKEVLRELLEKKEDVITQQKKKIKLLHQQVRRKNTTITDLRSAIKVLKEKELIDSDLADKLAETFPGLDGELMASQLNNKDRHNRGNRYSDPVKKISRTLCTFTVHTCI